MTATHQDLKQHLLTVLDTLPKEALAEVATFLDNQRYKLEQQGDAGPPYRPVPLAGLWNGVRVSDEDIAEARRDMWSRFADPES